MVIEIFVKIFEAKLDGRYLVYFCIALENFFLLRYAIFDNNEIHIASNICTARRNERWRNLIVQKVYNKMFLEIFVHLLKLYITE